MSEDFKIYADINGFERTNALLKSSRSNEPNAEIYRQRSGIVILEKLRITIIELTCPFEINFNNLRNSNQEDTTIYAKHSSVLVHNSA